MHGPFRRRRRPSARAHGAAVGVLDADHRGRSRPATCQGRRHAALRPRVLRRRPQRKGASDYFLVVFDHQAMDYTFTTSTAIQTTRSTACAVRRPASDDGLQSYRLRLRAGRRWTSPSTPAPPSRRPRDARRAPSAVRSRGAGRRRERGPRRRPPRVGASWRQHEYRVTFLERLDEWAADSPSRCRPEQGRRQVEDVRP